MRRVYNHPGLPFSQESDIITRKYIEDSISLNVKALLLGFNKAWHMERIEAPLLIPKEYIKLPYMAHRIFSVGDYYLRPETTEATYAYAKSALEYNELNTPVCYWQHAKSARPDEPAIGNIYFKEFYQLEFQCLFIEDYGRDYQADAADWLINVTKKLTHLPVRMVTSNTSPAYSPKVLDIEVSWGGSWIEVASILVRTDVPFQINKKFVFNLEIGFGTDRLLETMESVA